MSSGLMSSPNHGKKTCATKANPERHGNVRSLFRIRRPPGEGARAFRRPGAARPPGDGSHGRLGSGKTFASAGRKNHSGAVSLRLAPGRKWRASHLYTYMVTLS